MSGVQEFKDQFGGSPEITVKSPGRINLIGEHVDYLDGCVMPIAIDRHLTIFAAPSGNNRCSIWPAGFGLSEPAEFDLSKLVQRELAEENWLNYVFGVISGYQGAGVDVPGFHAVITSDLPLGAGLSSSAALETAVALLIETMSGVNQDVVDRALLCQQAEHEWANVPCGIMDQLAVGAGREGQVLHLDCRDLKLSFIDLPQEVSILTAETGVKHALGDGEYRKRRESCDAALKILQLESFRDATLDEVKAKKDQLGDMLFRRARHAVTEMERVESFAKALRDGEVDRIAPLMRASHESLRDDFEVSCEELDALVAAAYDFGTERGLIGSRMTGGGFGGSTVSLVRSSEAGALCEMLEKSYQEKFGRKLNCFITSAVDGARAATI
tara:strand:+ start:3544 stop:4698 length:1155 start_codon:yes stop_codon:yes gene_type:complete